MVDACQTAGDDLAAEEVVARVLRGHTDAFEHIIRWYQRDVHRVVSALLYDREQTEDLVQQAFVNAYVRLSSYEPGRGLRPWLRSIARNLVREELRRRGRYARRLKMYAEILAARLRDEGAASLHEELLHESLAKWRKRLAKHAAKALDLFYAERKSTDEIAEIMGCTANAVRQLLCRTRAKLRECIEKEMTQS